MHAKPRPAALPAQAEGVRTETGASGTGTDATIAALLRVAAGALAGTSDSPRLDAELLLAHALGWRREALYMRGDEHPPEEALHRFEALLEERQLHRPVAQLLGRREFRSLAFIVTPDVLTPRPETELLVESALAALPASGAAAVLDLGTGTGALAISIAAGRPHTEVLATDSSEAALAVAARNLRRLLADPACVRLARGDWFEAVPAGHFDVIVSNPPYLDEADWSVRAPELDHEPRAALYGGADGLDALRAVIAGAQAHLRIGGSLLVEHGARQGAAVRALFQGAGFGSVRTFTDTAGHERVTSGRRAG